MADSLGDLSMRDMPWLGQPADPAGMYERGLNLRERQQRLGMDEDKLGMIKQTHQRDLQRLDLANELAARSQDSRVNLLSNQAENAGLLGMLTRSQVRVANATEKSKVAIAQSDALAAASAADIAANIANRNLDVEKRRLEDNAQFHTAQDKIYELSESFKIGAITAAELSEQVNMLSAGLPTHLQSSLKNTTDEMWPMIMAKEAQSKIITDARTLSPEQNGHLYTAGMKPEDHPKYIADAANSNNLIKTAQSLEVDEHLISQLKAGEFSGEGAMPTIQGAGASKYLPQGATGQWTVNTWDKGMLTPEGRNLLSRAIEAKKAAFGPVSKVTTGPEGGYTIVRDPMGERKLQGDAATARLKIEKDAKAQLSADEKARADRFAELFPKILTAIAPDPLTRTPAQVLQALNTASIQTAKVTGQAQVPNVLRRGDLSKLTPGDLYREVNQEGQVMLRRMPGIKQVGAGTGTGTGGETPEVSPQEQAQAQAQPPAQLADVRKIKGLEHMSNKIHSRIKTELGYAKHTNKEIGAMTGRELITNYGDAQHLFAYTEVNNLMKALGVKTSRDTEQWKAQAPAPPVIAQIEEIIRQHDSGVELSKLDNELKLTGVLRTKVYGQLSGSTQVHWTPANIDASRTWLKKIRTFEANAEWARNILK